MIDFLIYYEHKVRELDYILLLKVELEKRGYSVELCYTGISFLKRRRKYYKKVHVVVTMAMYRDYDLYRQVYSVTGPIERIVNLQWEQVYTNEIQLAYDTPHYPKGMAKKIPHLCWGKAECENLKKAGIDSKNIVLTGPLHMDFLFPPLISFYKNKQNLLQEFELSPEHPTYLFISSFACAAISDQQKKELKWCFDEEQLEYLKWINVSSKNKLLDWFGEFLTENTKCNFIYRPHPGELEDVSLIKMEKRYQNFKVIKEYSVKQWILASDKVLTWMSTSAADTFFAGINCAVLRPINVRPEKDMTIFNHAEFICDYERFKEYITKDTVGSLNAEILMDYYDVDQNKLSYKNICSLLENVLEKETFKVEWDHKTVELFQKKLLKDTVTEIVKTILRPPLYMFYILTESRRVKVSQKVRERITMYKKVTAQKEKDCAALSEIEEIQNRLQSIIG